MLWLASNPKGGIDPDLHASVIDKLQANSTTIGYLLIQNLEKVKVEYSLEFTI